MARLYVLLETLLGERRLASNDSSQPSPSSAVSRRGDPVFYVFDLLWLNGEDLRERPLVERKRLLRSIVPEKSPALLYADHIEQNGIEFFRLVCDRDLEGMVAKYKWGCYGESWYKIRNPNYTQYEGRHELFEKRAAAI